MTLDDHRRVLLNDRVDRSVREATIRLMQSPFTSTMWSPDAIAQLARTIAIEVCVESLKLKEFESEKARETLGARPGESLPAAAGRIVRALEAFTLRDTGDGA